MLKYKVEVDFDNVFTLISVKKEDYADVLDKLAESKINFTSLPGKNNDEGYFQFNESAEKIKNILA
jgi:hypothetical protein